MGLCLTTGAVALLSLLGHLAGSASLAALGRGFIPMSPIAVGMVLLLTAALLLLETRPGVEGIRWMAVAMAAGVAALSLAFVVGHALGGSLALERWLLRSWPRLQLTSLLTDVAVLSCALSLLCRRRPAAEPWSGRQAAALFALLPQIIGGVVLVSYAAGTPLLYGSGRIPMSAPSALCSLVFGFTLSLTAGWNTWPLAAFRTAPGRSRGLFGTPSRAMALFLFLGTLILIGGSIYLKGQIRTTRARVHAELATIAEAKAQQISFWQAERRADAEVIAKGALIQAQLRRFLEASPLAPSEPDLRAWMEALQKRAYRRVVLFDGQGRVRISVPASDLPSQEDMDAAEVHQALVSPAVLVTDLHQHPGRTDIHLGLWAPIRAHANGTRAVGALLLMVDPRQFLYPMVESWPTASPSAESLLVRRDGDQVLFLNDLRHRPHTAMALRHALAANPGMPGTRAVLGEEGLVLGKDYRGVPVLSVLKQIPGTTWRLVAKVDEAEVYGPLRTKVWSGAVVLLGLVSLLAAGLGVMLRQHDAAMVRKQLHFSQRFEWLMREANDIIFLLDGTGRILEANARATESYGYDLSELVEMNVYNLRVPEDREEGRGLYERMREVGSTRFESIHQRRDGSTFPVEVSARALHLDGELRVISFVRDITDRRQQEHDLQRMTQLYSALSQVNQSIVWSPTREALFARICEVMVVFGKFDMAWIGWNDSLLQRVSVVASHGDAKGYLDRIRVESGPSAFGAGPVGTAIREACPCVVNDFLTSAGTTPWREAAADSGFNSVAAFPIRLAGAVVGALAVYSKEQDFFGAREAELLVEAAMDISFALDHMAGEEQRRSTEVALMESERLLKEAQVAGGVGTYTWFIREDRWVSSPYLDEIFGIGPEHPRDLQGWMEIIAPDFRERMQAYVAGIIERHESFNLDYPILRRADRARRWVHGQGEIHRDAEDRPLAMVGIIQDITERKLAEQSLRKISMAVEQCPLSIVITDPHGVIEYVNPMFTQVTGYGADEVIGQNPRVLKSPATPPGHYREMWETLARGEVWVGEFENLKKSGDPFHERATIAPVRDASGELAAYIAIKADITLQKKEKAERRALEAQLHQSQKLESLGSLAGGVAHDMNNVLGAILGLASTLRETADPFSTVAKNLDTIVNACMRGRGVVKGLLYFAKKDLQEERPTDLNDMVHEMAELLGHTTLKRVELRLDLQEGLGLVRGDAGAMSHALMNLCVNALDAMPVGGTLRIHTAGLQDGRVAIRVADTGEGMAPDVLAKAMEPFFTTKPQGKGTGLGLAMVYGTMKAHEGTFDLHSRPGHGTEAILTFPASRVIQRELLEEPAPTATPEASGALRILLVDDDDLIRESVTPMLEILGHTVTSAPGGVPALRLLEGGLEVDLLILDMNMPGMSGAEVLPLALGLWPGLHVIMATGYSDQEVKPLLEGHPTVSGLRKPFSLKEIEGKITQLGIQPTLGVRV